MLELDDFECGKVLRQAAQVVERGATPAIDRLVIVAHSGEAGFLADQTLEHFVLRGVGVLVFVDQYMCELRLPFFTHFVVVL